RHLGMEISDLELRYAVLRGKLLDGRDEIVHPPVAARVARRADDERDAALARGREEELQLFAGEVPQRDVLAEVHRARVRAAAVGDDVIGPGFHPEMEALRTGRRGAEMAGRDEHAQSAPGLCCHEVIFCWRVRME